VSVIALQTQISVSVALAVVTGIVAPLYAAVGYIFLRMGIFKGHSEDVDANDKRIQQMQQSLARVETEVEALREDNRVLHSHLTERNHCGVETCRFCEGSPGDHEDPNE
jgi:cell division protein FtsL